MSETLIQRLRDEATANEVFMRLPLVDGVALLREAASALELLPKASHAGVDMVTPTAGTPDADLPQATFCGSRYGLTDTVCRLRPGHDGNHWGHGLFRQWGSIAEGARLPAVSERSDVVK